jgi:hypothetical protein
MATTIPQSPITLQDERALKMGLSLESDQTTLLNSYALTDSSKPEELKKVSDALGLTFANNDGKTVKNANGETFKISAKALQIIAEQRFQQTSSRLTLFSNLMERMAQMRQQLINNMKG